MDGQRQESPAENNEIKGQSVFLGHDGQIFFDFGRIEFRDVDFEVMLGKYLLRGLSDSRCEKNISVGDDFV